MGQKQVDIRDLLGKFQAQILTQPIDRGIKYRCIQGSYQDLKQETADQQSTKEAPLDFAKTTEQEEDGKGVYKLRGEGREVIAQPQVFPFGDPLPEVEDVNVDILGQQIGHHGGKDRYRSGAKDLGKEGVVYRAPCGGRNSIGDIDDQQGEK